MITIKKLYNKILHNFRSWTRHTLQTLKHWISVKRYEWNLTFLSETVISYIYPFLKIEKLALDFQHSIFQFSAKQKLYEMTARHEKTLRASLQRAFNAII